MNTSVVVGQAGPGGGGGGHTLYTVVFLDAVIGVRRGLYRNCPCNREDCVWLTSSLAGVLNLREETQGRSIVADSVSYFTVYQSRSAQGRILVVDAMPGGPPTRGWGRAADPPEDLSVSQQQALLDQVALSSLIFVCVCDTWTRGTPDRPALLDRPGWGQLGTSFRGRPGPVDGLGAMRGGSAWSDTGPQRCGMLGPRGVPARPPLCTPPTTLGRSDLSDTVCGF